MFRNFRKGLGLVAVGALVAAAGCGDDKMTTPMGEGTVIIEFEHEVDGVPLQLNQMIYTTAAGNSYSVSLLEYVLTQFSLHPTVEGELEDFEDDVVHYANQDNDQTWTVGFTDVPAGSYNELKFRFGVEGTMNPNTIPFLDQVGMGWPVQNGGGGYHYMRNEGSFIDSQSMTLGFTTHLGPSMGTDYSHLVTLDVPAFTVDNGNVTTIRVTMDINQFYEDPNIYDFNDYGMIMGNPGAQLLLQENVDSVFSLAGVN